MFSNSLKDEIRPEGTRNECIEQIAFADRILLNKTDLVPLEQLDSVSRRIWDINKTAKIIPTKYSKVNLDAILDIEAFDLNRILAMDSGFFSENEQKEHNHEHHGEHCSQCEQEKSHEEERRKRHDLRVGSVGIELEGELDYERVNYWLQTLLQSRGQDIFRMKGIFSINKMNKKYVFQGVHQLVEGSTLGDWGENEKRISKIVFIGRNLDRAELTKSFKECLA